jgi:hypothetical protein
MRNAALLLCLGLAACAGANAKQELTAAPEVTGSVHSPLARAAQASGKNADWWKEGGVTREKINGMCWMKYETGQKDLPVEKRADLVNQCVIDTLKEYPVN